MRTRASWMDLARVLLCTRVWSLLSMKRETVNPSTKSSLRSLRSSRESHHTPDECLAFENSSWVLFIHGQKDSGGLSELGKHKLLAPNLSLATQTVKADQSQIVDQLLLFERSS